MILGRASLVRLSDNRVSSAASASYLSPLLYQRASSLFRDITVGDNGGYHATPGWDACTGFGSPDGTALLEFLGGVG